MTLKLVKKTEKYSIYKRGDQRYAVRDANKAPINGDEKAAILVAEGLVAAPAEKAAPEEAPAEEGGEEAAEEESES